MNKFTQKFDFDEIKLLLKVWNVVVLHKTSKNRY